MPELIRAIVAAGGALLGAVLLLAAAYWLIALLAKYLRARDDRGAKRMQAYVEHCEITNELAAAAANPPRDVAAELAAVAHVPPGGRHHLTPDLVSATGFQPPPAAVSHTTTGDVTTDRRRAVGGRGAAPHREARHRAGQVRPRAVPVP